MKFATIVLMGIMLLGSPAAFSAGDPAGASEVAIGFNGGSTWTSGSTGICIWSFPVLGDLNLGSLYATGSSGAPVVDRAHSYLIWVSDFSVEALPPPVGPIRTFISFWLPPEKPPSISTPTREAVTLLTSLTGAPGVNPWPCLPGRRHLFEAAMAC
jgi:hypothetical protein